MELFGSLIERKIVLEIDKVKLLAQALRDVMKLKIVTTIGTWDMLHIGHLRYLNKARSYGDFLLVGVDSDKAVGRYKNREPFDPQDQRMEVLSHQACVSMVTLIDDIDENGKWGYELIEKVRPCVFIAVEDSYPEEQRVEIKKHCGELVILPKQAENISTTAKMRTVAKQHFTKMLKEFDNLGV